MTAMFSRRKFLVRTGMLIGSGVFATALANCTPKPTPTSAPKAATAAPKATQPAVAPTAAPAVKATLAPATLTIWHIWGGSRIPLMEDMFKRFSEANPGLKVEHTLVPGGERLQKIQTAIAGGTPPSLAMINQYEVPMFASRKSVNEIDSLMARDGIKHDIFYDYAIRQSQWEGKTYTLPNASAAWMHYFYNTAQFKEVGLDPDKAPETWDQLIDTSKKLTLMDGKKIKRLGLQFYNGLPGQDDFFWALYSNNGKLISDDKRKVAFNSPEGLEALKFLQRALKEIYGDATSYQDWGSVQGTTDVAGPFIAGTCAARHGGVWEIFYIKSGKPDLPYTLGLLSHSAKGQGRQGAYGAWSYGIPVGVKTLDQAWQLVKWVCVEKSAACWFMQQQLRPSPLKSCNEDKYYSENFPKWELIQKQLTMAGEIPLTPATNEINTRITAGLEQVNFGKMTPEQALETMEKESQALLDESYKKLG